MQYIWHGTGALTSICSAWSFDLAKAITGDHLLAAVNSQTFIKDGDPKGAEGIKYDFRMGSRILKAAYGQPLDMDGLTENERTGMFVEPGEVVFVLTEESLELPNDMMAQLVPKRKLSHQGIIALGGFCVDPLYKGKLLVGLYNFSSTRFPLIPRKKLIAAVFYRLEDDEIGAFPEPEAELNDFPDELIHLIQGYKPIAIGALQEGLEETQRQLDNLRTDLLSGREWQRQFQESLERHDKQIDKLLVGLEEEKTNRGAADQSFKDQLTQIQLHTWKNAIKLSAIVAGIVLILSALLQAVLPPFIQWLRSGH
jgi:deoxycytidine triphosphate deaminase